MPLSLSPVPRHSKGAGSLRTQGAREIHLLLENFLQGQSCRVCIGFCEVSITLCRGARAAEPPTARAPKLPGGLSATPWEAASQVLTGQLAVLPPHPEVEGGWGVRPTAANSTQRQGWTPRPPSLTQGQFGQLSAAVAQMHADTQNETPVRRKAREGIDFPPPPPNS